MTTTINIMILTHTLHDTPFSMLGMFGKNLEFTCGSHITTIHEIMNLKYIAIHILQYIRSTFQGATEYEPHTAVHVEIQGYTLHVHVV